MMAGRPEAVTLARALPSNPAAMLVLADQDVRDGNWTAAQAKFAALPGEGLTQVLKPLLVAWAQQGAGKTDDAIETLQPGMDGSRYRGVYALHAAMINDLSGRPADAAQFFRTAVAEYGGLNLRLGTLLASWQARSGNEAEARQTIRAMMTSSPELAIAEPALQLDAAQRQITSASDGIAEAYLALAATLQQQDAMDFAVLLLRQAIELRPSFTAARMLAADVEASRGQVAMAAQFLAPVLASDPLIAVVQLRRARLEERLGQLDKAQATLEQLAKDYPDRPERWPSWRRCSGAPVISSMPRTPTAGRWTASSSRAELTGRCITSRAWPTTARMTGRMRRQTSCTRWICRPTSLTS